MIDKITKIINDWDPIDLLPMAPEDEYIKEIEFINKFINYNYEVSEDNLAVEIHQLFKKSFGSDVYSCDQKECLKIARKILKSC